jgi:perosamine synthetase
MGEAPRIRISQPRLGGDVERLVLTVLRSGQLAQGPMVARFEALCASMAGTRHAVALNTGTAALEAALHVAGVQPGDEVITSPFTFAATLNAIVRRGAVARFADVTADFTIDPASVATLIGARTRAIMPVHLYGLPCDMPALVTVAEPGSLAIIEDAAQAHGAIVAGRRAGSFGLGCFSFYATKNVTSGEGGCVTTDDDEHAAAMRVLRNQGMRERYEYVAIGENWRMTDVAAAIAIPQLENLDRINEARRDHAARLSALLQQDERIRLPLVPPDRTHAWHQYTVLLPEGTARDDVVASMRRDGIECGVYYPRLVWDYDAYRDHIQVSRDATPNAAAVAQRCLSLPVHQGLDGGDLERVAAALLRALR